MAVKGVKVSDYGGKSLNIDSGSSTIVIDPIEENRFKHIKVWYKNSTAGGKQLETQHLTQVGESAVNPSMLPMVMCEEIQQMIM